MTEFKNAFVVTGTIGSGKSTFCTLLKMHGYSVIDVDKIAHEILDGLNEQISNIFGLQCVCDGKVNRKMLANIVFNDAKKLKELEEMTHPLIGQKTNDECEKLEKFGVAYFVDIPLFFEKFSSNNFNKVIVVYAPNDTLLSRIIARNGWSKEHALSRLKLQIDIEKKRKMANFVIDNSKNLQHLQDETDRFLLKIKDIKC